MVQADSATYYSKLGYISERNITILSAYLLYDHTKFSFVYYYSCGRCSNVSWTVDPASWRVVAANTPTHTHTHTHTPTTLLHPILRIRQEDTIIERPEATDDQFWGSVTFWCGSSDPYLWLTDPDPALDPTFFIDFKDPKKCHSFFLYLTRRHIIFSLTNLFFAKILC
jgi:hypothetical protein